MDIAHIGTYLKRKSLQNASLNHTVHVDYTQRVDWSLNLEKQNRKPIDHVLQVRFLIHIMESYIWSWYIRTSGDWLSGMILWLAASSRFSFMTFCFNSLMYLEASNTIDGSFNCYKQEQCHRLEIYFVIINCEQKLIN